MNDEIMVSVCCTAYNHEKYIRQCLDGFVMQETNFKYEVIISDDASTDTTAEIIREYEEKYPEIIKPIYLQENQYSKGVNITFRYLYPNAKGRYIALCEGDDFWTDPLKLQKQVDTLEANPTCHMCVSKVMCVSENGTDYIGTHPSFNINGGIIKSGTVLSYVLNQYTFQTSSYLFRTDDIRNYMNPIPKFREISPVGDLCYLMYFCKLGDIFYIEDAMSCYRVGSAGSWTKALMQNREKVKEHNCRMIDVIREYDTFTEGRFHEICESGIWSRLNLNSDSKQEFRELVKYNPAIFNKQPLKRKCRVYLGAYCQPLYKLYYKLFG